MRISGSTAITVDAAPAACYAVAVDLAAYAAWYPGVSRAEVLTSRGGPTARLHFDAGLAVLPPFSCVMSLQEQAPHRLTPRVRSGPVSVGGEGWTFDSTSAGATAVVLDLHVEMGIPGGRLAERIIGGRGRRYLIEEPACALRRRVLELRG